MIEAVPLPAVHRGLPKILLPMKRSDWIVPSEAQFKDIFGNENRQLWRLRARVPGSRRIEWQGWFEDREDADAFLWAIATGTIYQEPELWRLPMPCWDPDLNPGLEYDFASPIFIISGTTQTSPADWNNSNNTVEGIGAGASGAVSSGASHATGGGGGEYRMIANFSVATPGTTAFNYVIGAGGTAVTAGVDTAGHNGSDVTFNTTSLVAKAGLAGAVGAGSKNGGAGGTGGTGAAANFDGGRGGNMTGASGNGGSGGGGAAGSTGVGNNGGDTSSTGTILTTAGGSGDGGVGGSAGTTAGGTGGNGTEWDATHGSGGGGGGNAAAGTGILAGSGGNYGGGGGGVRSGSGTPSSGAGIKGILVLIYTPAAALLPISRRLRPIAQYAYN